MPELSRVVKVCGLATDGMSATTMGSQKYRGMRIN
jgi:hypothetical protein